MHRFILFVPLALAACVADTGPHGARLFASECAACHGTTAKGNGPLAATLSPTPPDLTLIAARNGGVFPRNRVMTVIDGLARGAHGASAMPEFGAGDMGPQIMTDENGIPVPVPADLLALADYLASLQQDS